MKTNHQRGFKGNIDAPRRQLKSGVWAAFCVTNGNHGISRARHGLKKHFRKIENKIINFDTIEQIRELND